VTYAASSQPDRIEWERARAYRARQHTTTTTERLPASPDGWLRALFPSYVAHPFAPRHDALWDWAWSVELGRNVDPFVACWGRGGAKSTSAELVTVRWGATKARRYGLYLSNTQDQADDHVQTIATLMETKAIAAHYPHLADRMVGKYGQSKGWRRNRVRCSDGFTIDALGMDSARRGAKLDDQRPDFLIIDDVDDGEDSEAVTAKKARLLTRKILPALTSDAAILFIQNKVHDDGLMAQVLDGRADFLGGAQISGPHPAIEGLQVIGSGTEARIVAGRATWEGQSLDACQAFIQTWGLDAFLAECQHESVARAGRFLSSIGLWDACQEDLPPLDRHTPIVLGIDAGESSDTFAIVGVSRHPRDGRRLAVRFSRVYVPNGGVLDFDQIEQDITALCRHLAVVELSYDRFLMGQMVRRLAGKLPCPMEPFSQAGDRLEADKALRDDIQARTLSHDGTHTDLRQHLDNANAKASADGRQVRIVKRSKSKKIDLAVALSMAHARASVLLAAVFAPPHAPTVQSRWGEM
jgi:hypothetical protein